MSKSGTQHWITIEHPQSGIVELCLNSPGVTQNVLSSAVIAKLDEAITTILKSKIKGLIFSSGKTDGFIVGADIEEFKNLENSAQAKQQAAYANKVLDRIESLPIPTVAVINGHCFGGGYELALACDFRVMVDQHDSRIGLPEVKLGIHPGFGGTVRLPETIGIIKAMELILAGRVVSPYSARKAGMVDYIVPPRQLISTAVYLINHPAKRKNKRLIYELGKLAPARKLLTKFLEYQITKKANPKHYPSPFAVIKNWSIHGGSRESLFEQEQKTISKLLTSSTSKNLVEVFFLQNHLKQSGKASKHPKIQRVHIIGAGVMGGDIAAWCALKGFSVTLHDRSPAALARASKRAYDLFQYKLKNNRLVERAMDRFSADTSGDGVRQADLIVEAVFENLEVKQQLFKAVEQNVKPDAILATNSSSIPLENIAEALKKPSRLVGIHFFNPVAKMQLIEIVEGEKTAKKVKQAAALFSREIGKLPVMVKSSPGFLVNRVLMPYAMEAVELLKQGIPAPTIDQAATNFGMPMGPITLADTVGLDICLHVAENLRDTVGLEIPEILIKKVEQGELGKKSGQGFYTWIKGKAQYKSVENAYPETAIQSRLVCRYLNECIACLDDGIVDDKKSLDAALVFGTGFAPFRGGPMRYIQQVGAEVLLQTQKSLSEQHGDRFRPAKGWEKLIGN